MTIPMKYIVTRSSDNCGIISDGLIVELDDDGGGIYAKLSIQNATCQCEEEGKIALDIKEMLSIAEELSALALLLENEKKEATNANT